LALIINTTLSPSAVRTIAAADFQFDLVRTEVMMRVIMFRLMHRIGLVFICLVLPVPHSNAQTGEEHWVVSWTAAPAPYIGLMMRPPESGLEALRGNGILNNQTIRMQVRTSIGGRQVRIRLSNLFGKTALRIGAAHVALLPDRTDEPSEASIISGTDRTLLFGGMPTASIPAGQSILSDPADLAIPAMASVAVSLYIPERSPDSTTHYAGRLAGVVSAPGDFSGKEAIHGARFGTHLWVSSLDVLAPPDAGTVVVVSDDSTIVSYPAWPAALARRMITNPETAKVAVVTQADSGARFSFTDQGLGLTALERFDRDVLGQAGVRWIVLAPFLPEILYSTRPASPWKSVSVVDLAKVFEEIVKKSHRKGIKVIGCTVMPSSLPQNGEEQRLAVNNWIRTSGVFDDVIDLDKITSDPAHPERLRQVYATGGTRTILADEIDLSLFAQPRQR